ncbi:MAG: hypothetical protein ACLQFM_09445 [Terriglobales bacterium]|jgi:hypothetical protein
MKDRMIAVAFIAIAALLNVGSIASAQNDPHRLGTSGSGFAAGLAKPQQQLTIPLTALYTSASYGTGGVALRNRSKGDIHISGVTGPTQAAWLYWAVLFNSPTAAQLKAAAEVTLQREYPTGVSASAQIHGTLLAIGGDPCWGSQGTWVYRGAVPTSLATGNGIYRVIIGSKAVGLSDGEDPWDGNLVFPLWEGASLVIIGTGGASVGLLDGQAGTTFATTTLSNYYTLPAPVAAGSQVLLDNIGYDGQVGDSRTIFSGPGFSATNETTYVSGFPSDISVFLAGQGGETGNSDWDGSSGWPLPQLWDDTGHDISNAFAAGDNLVLVSYTSTYDCIGTVAAVVSVQ